MATRFANSGVNDDIRERTSNNFEGELCHNLCREDITDGLNG
ncbi:hypothetical protein BT93_C0533 [Corymbia citriodora subsp. variegata]|nr:hypothetical protein BT93_C0533 [Corymbia citriodora subsp. variegata]